MPPRGLVQLAVEQLLGFEDEAARVVRAEDAAQRFTDRSEAAGGVGVALEVPLVAIELLLPSGNVLHDEAQGIDVVERSLPSCKQGANEFIFLCVAHGKNGCGSRAERSGVASASYHVSNRQQGTRPVARTAFSDRWSPRVSRTFPVRYG